MNQIITLLSDWRLRDPYVAMLKGELLKAQPEAQLIDITHYVDKFNLLQTALLMKTSYTSFPEGSVHLILTNMSLNSTFSPVALFHNGHWFIGEDNGVFFLMFGQEAALKGFQLADNEGNALQQTLLMLQQIAAGNLADENRQIDGHIVYVDAFNNAVTDIPASMFAKAVGKRPFTATIQSKGVWTITKHFGQYEASDNEMFLSDNALGLLEVASFQSDVAVLADLEPGDKIIIKYE